MNRRIIIIAAVSLGAIVGLVGVFVLLRQPALPSGLGWPAQRLTPTQAEVVSDSLAALADELRTDVASNQGRGTAQIVQRWQGPRTNQPLDHHLSRFLQILQERGRIDIINITYVLRVAQAIDDLAESGEIEIQSQVHGPDVIILIESTSTGEIRQVEFRRAWD